ncbi:HEPN domain-containing protein [Methanospirillum lacunae]|uniref:HEPN domain-containing protein n=1 Tax=Methanospirillum lacunae TaxID=668570 RepID=A0A2V2N157_9EURY|nr:HEPN domain-containing protein [Methanospirillum lacunae]PWR71396.1 hypothetical protein DK846_11055 [Methanospirillum lacunae]
MIGQTESVKLWCLKAENDLKNACHEVEHEDPALDTVCFHAQQAAEKYLKVFLLFHDCENQNSRFNAAHSKLH